MLAGLVKYADREDSALSLYELATTYSDSVKYDIKVCLTDFLKLRINYL
jgi:hypothetical protein